MAIHVKLYKTNIYKKSVIKMETNSYYKMPGDIKEKDSYKASRKELISCLL